MPQEFLELAPENASIGVQWRVSGYLQRNYCSKINCLLTIDPGLALTTPPVANGFDGIVAVDVDGSALLLVVSATVDALDTFVSMCILDVVGIVTSVLFCVVEVAEVVATSLNSCDGIAATTC